MANNDENVQVAEQNELENDVFAGAVPGTAVVKSKKELKKERKAIKKHKKEVKKEAARHSAKSTKAQNVLLSLISLFVIVAMLVCSVTSLKIAANIGKATEQPANAVVNNNSDSNNNSNGGSATPSTPSTPAADSQNNDAPAADNNDAPAADNNNDAPAADNNNDAPPAGGVAGLSTKEEIVDYYKAAYAKAMSSAKKATRTYDNTTNYNNVVEVNNNDRLASLAQQLMNQFMKENTDREEHTSDIAAVFPAKGNTSNLTADMLSEATVKEEGNNYIITMKIDSTEENPDLGDKTRNLVTIVETTQITDAVGSLISFDGLENRYIGATAIATVDKATGNLIALETDAPSYMCFGQVTAFVIVKVSNCRLGLEYQQKWELEY